MVFICVYTATESTITARSHAVYSVDPSPPAAHLPAFLFSITGHAGKIDLNAMTLRTHGTGGLTPVTFCGGAFDDCGHEDGVTRETRTVIHTYTSKRPAVSGSG